VARFWEDEAMTRKIQISPSVLTADFARLGEDVASVAPHVDQFHLDVMDGHYVPNLTFGPDVVAAIRRHTDLPFNVHLMIEEPLKYAERFAAVGADRITFHPEVVEDVAGAIAAVRSTGAGVGLAIHPDVELDTVKEHLGDVDVILVMTVRPGFGGQSFLSEVVPKIASARRMVEENGLSADIEVDGGVNTTTVEQVLEAGADIVVAGSAIFDGKDAPGAALRLRRKIENSGAKI
jgi:ribulose-phosphate 3-epimerase